MNNIFIHKSSYIDEHVKIGVGTKIWHFSHVLKNCIIGEYAMIAAGSVVTKDVRPHALMMGVPAKQAGWVCECGVRLVPDADTGEGAYGCSVCGRMYTLSCD